MQIHSNFFSTSMSVSLNLTEPGFYFYWIGQAGFAFKINNTRILIDPYLSDSLAEKYKDTIYPHTRMMNAPIELNKLAHINWVLCTHRHTDHMDPVTLRQIHTADPLCQFLIPKAWVQRIHECDIPKELVSPINADESVLIDENIKITSIPSAHEDIEMDSENNHLYLGYIIQTNFVKIYHSGDCVPFPGLIENLRDKNIDVAFLPVNGRDAYRKKHSVPGNFTIDEAINICIRACIPHLVCHHFGMFDFNTIDQELLYKRRQENDKILNIVIPEINNQYQITKN